MSDEFSLALQLMVTGMVTVFIILFLVVGIGSTIIKFVNRFLPELGKVVAVKAVSTSVGFDTRKVAAITSAVSIVTNGKGRVVKIEKV